MKVVTINSSPSGNMGNIIPICEWLIENVHQHIMKYLPTELVERVTRSSIDTGSYLVYLRSNY